MRPSLIALTATAALALPAGAGAGTSSCGHVANSFITNIRATSVSCAKARHVARLWYHRAVTNGEGPGGTKTIGRYRCVTSAGGDAEHVRVACRHKQHPKRRVRFNAGP